MYEISESLLKRALEIIPNGTQTFSRSQTQFPFGVSPFYVSRAEGSKLWDADGNEFVDFVSALCPIILGYNDPDVNEAVHQQVDNGVLFSLPHPLEIEVSEKIIDLVPCAEMVRFGKNGSDATTGAIRLARAYTGRDHVAQCGYHGWHDWSMANTGRNLGIPQAVKDLTHTFEYNNIESLHRIFKARPNQFACVIMEPMNNQFPEDGFLEECREIAHANGALFIFDETITGFRYAIGGAQEYFDVIPDVATFGKAIANGYPLSAITGSEEVMRTLERVHYSYTNASECISLAAAMATLEKLEREDIPSKLAELGRYLPGTGHPAWRHFSFNGYEHKTLFLQEAHKRGLLCLGTANLTAAHSLEEVARLADLYLNLEGELECEPLKPLFKVR